MTTGSDCPNHIGGIGDIDVIIDHHDEFTLVGSGTGAGGNQQRLFRVAGITLLDGYDTMRPRLTAINESPNAFDLRNSRFLQLFPLPGSTLQYCP